MVTGDHLARLASRTARDDRALLRRRWHDHPVTTPEEDAALLAAFRARWPARGLDGGFDELNVAIDAPRDGALMVALAPVRPRVVRLYGGRRLTARNEEDALLWMMDVRDRPAGGLVLRRDPIGWWWVGPA